MMDGLAALGVLSRERTGELVFTHMSANHDWSKVSGRAELDMPLNQAMGKASSLGLGFALARPDLPVWVLDGDGSLLMNLGSLVTIAAMAPKNLVHWVYENDAYDTTGGQPIPGGGKADFGAMARGAGYPRAFVFEGLEDLQNRVKEVLAGPHPTLAVLKVPSHGRRPPASLPTTVEAFARIKGLLAQRQ